MAAAPSASVALCAAPSTVVTLIFPVTAPSGTLNCSCVAVLGMSSPGGTIVAPDLHRRRPGQRAQVRPRDVDRSVALPPTALPGVKLVIFGATLKLTVLGAVPTRFVMLTGPVSAPAGTTACSDVAVTLVGATDPAAPANVTPVAPARFVPVIVTAVPTGPAAGANPSPAAAAPPSGSSRSAPPRPPSSH